MVNRFAKLFNFETGQLLVTLEYDPDDGRLLLLSRTYSDDVRSEFKASFNDTDDANAAFDGFSQQQATEQYNCLQNPFRISGEQEAKKQRTKEFIQSWI